MIGLGVVLVLAASFVLPGLLKGNGHGGDLGYGMGLRAGTAVPAFSGRDVVSGQLITSTEVYDQKTLLFFFEGVMCQACLQQIQGLQKLSAELDRMGIQLVSISPDPATVLSQAADQYGITTPLISDSDLGMSEAFNTIGLGMHADTPGHAFALIYHGKVIWYRDYYLPPYRTMYVPPHQIISDVTHASDSQPPTMG